MRRLALAAAVLAVLAGGLGEAVAQDRPRVYVSLPLTGFLGPESKGIVDAVQLAVEEAGSPVELVVLDDATKQANSWTPERVAANARRAAQDPRTIAYIGEFNSGASAISIPILNEAGILQVSPSNAAPGLTRSEAAEPGEPDKYYPRGTRTFARVVGADHLEAAALAKVIERGGAKRLFLLDDKESYGAGMAKMVRRRTDVRVVGSDGIDARARGYRGLARRVRRARADAVFFGGITDNHAARLWRDLHRAVPKARLYGAAGVAEDRFARAISRGARRRTHITLGTLPTRAWVPAGRAFADRYRAKYGASARGFAAAGYEAADAVLDAIAAGAGDRQRTIDALFFGAPRDGVLGAYTFDANGDPTTARFGLYGVSHRGRLTFDRVVTAP
jgi:branched-chain amino acid transport system substrate-binding protein